MIGVSQHLWFEKDMEAALRHYTSLVPGSSLGRIRALPAESPSRPSGSVLIAEFTLGDQSYQAIQAGPLDPFNHSFSIVLACDDQAEIDRLWDALSEGGSIERCGWLRDRWGLSWQIVPKSLGRLMARPGPAGQRVAEKMLTMTKFDIAGLERAAAGEDG